MLQRMLFLLNGDLSPVLGGDSGAAVAPAIEAVAEGAGQAAAAVPPQNVGLFGGDMMWMVALYGAIIVGFYFLAIRPQRRRDKKMKELQTTLKVGDNVLTNGGMYGRIADIGHDCFIVEFGTNRGVRIPIRKSDVLGIQTPQITQTSTDKSN